MHGNQVCVPDATLLPSGIGRVRAAGREVTGDLRFCATEREQNGDTYIYDIAVRDASGTVVERWESLRLHAVRKGDGCGPWVPPLLGSHLERELENLLGVRVAVAVEPHRADDGIVDGRRPHTALAAGRAIGHPVTVRYRPDGRPELDGEQTVSASHCGDLTLCVVADGAGSTPLGCDVEAVAERPAEEWHGLLGHHASLAALVAKEMGEPLAAASTRVWSAIECLRKAGLPADAPLTLTPVRRDAWNVFESGALRIATLVTTMRDAPAPVVFAVLVEGRS
jgi:enediyne polyketide synthase